MSRKNAGFAADITAGIDLTGEVVTRRKGLASNVLGARGNRIAELASGAIVTRTHELVDPVRCRMWSGHNREYGMLNEERCADLIESLKAQGRQEIPAIVRRVSGDEKCDFEVICGARRHWTVSWLRANNYPDFKFLVDVREIGDEEAFRLADIENRARDDLTDIERARDYLKALNAYYGGRQKTMAERINVTESWLTRFLDLARLPGPLMEAFPEPQGLTIRNAIALKPLLKPEDKRERVFKVAATLGKKQAEDGKAMPILDVIRELTLASTSPKKSGSTKKSGGTETFSSSEGKDMLKIDGVDKKSIRLTLFPRGCAPREEVEQVLREVLDKYWS